MPINLSAEVTIAAAPADIAAVMFDPAREPEWVSAVRGVEILDRALAPGARVKHTVRVAARDVTVTTEVEAIHFPHVLALRLTDAPVTGSLRFEIQRTGEGSRVRLRGVAEPTGVLMAAQAALLEGPVRSMVEQDLERLKQIVEG